MIPKLGDVIGKHPPEYKAEKKKKVGGTMNLE